MIAVILNGLALGVLLMVLSSGLAMIFGLLDVVNFAHGAVYMLAAYIGMTVSQLTNFWVALVFTPVVFALLGLLIDRIGLRPLGNRDHLDMILITFGVTFVIGGVILLTWGSASFTVSAPSLLSGSVEIFGSSYPTYRVFLVVLGLLIGLALMLWIRFSKTGLYVRALSTHRTVAGAVGVNVDRVSGAVVAISLGLAGLAGVLAGPYLSISTNMGAEILVLTFIVVVTGGLGSIGGAMIAALAVGMLNSLSVNFLPDAAAYVPYLLMFAILLFRPRGIAGSRTV